MIHPPRRILVSVAVLAALAGGLGGCAASANLSYGEYHFGPDHRSERVYESRVFADSREGLGAQSCRSEARERVDAFGNVTVQDELICDGVPSQMPE